MSQQINRNILWCNTFVKQLIENGIKNVCISPGSRSTPLTLAFSLSKKFNLYPIVDERSSAFFALGLAKKSRTASVIITTSGTAVAEIYPAIIEAYYQRIPLIVCTADRPAYLRNRGANQTINQNNIFKNHIRFFYDTGLPNIDYSSFVKLTDNVIKGLQIALSQDPGPIHFNFPFDKPFEPDTYTDSVEKKLIKKIFVLTRRYVKQESENVITLGLKELIDSIQKKNKGIIVCGYNNYGAEFKKVILKLSDKTGYPIFADGSSGLRYGGQSSSNIIENYNALIRSDRFCKKFDPEIILLFGGAPTSNQMHDFVKRSRAEKIIINQFGDKNDPTLTAKKLIRINPVKFCKTVLSRFTMNRVNDDWLNDFINMNMLVDKIKKRFIGSKNYSFESKVIFDLLNFIPDKCNLMISNSLPIRDVDFYSSCSEKQIQVFTNRGASGIDGINSTASGIAVSSGQPTFLLTGDLAFYHDLNGLYNSVGFNIPITIILINNSGGGIFHSLPISRYGKIFRTNFLTPLKLEFNKIVKAFNGIYYIVKGSKEFNAALKKSIKNGKLSVIEIKTNAKLSSQYRSRFWKITTDEVGKYINDYKN
jgi:2-succinyl-5-enolpyruvyl-6-hydroxy-3-cyclohexene-1-carboxylate synthase